MASTEARLKVLRKVSSVGKGFLGWWEKNDPTAPLECASLEELQPWLDIRELLDQAEQAGLDAMLVTGGNKDLGTFRSEIKRMIADIEEAQDRLS